MGQNASFRMVFSAEATVQHIDSEAEQLLGWDIEAAQASGMGLLHPSDRLAFGAMLKFLRSQPEADASLEIRLVSGQSDDSWIPATVSAANAFDDVETPGLHVNVELTDVAATGPNPALLPTPVDSDLVLSSTAGSLSNGSSSNGSSATSSDPSHATTGVQSFGPFDQDATDDQRPAPLPVSASYDPPEATDIGILLRPGSSIIDVVTGPVQGKLGCHPDSLAGLHLWELLHRDDEVEFTEALDSMEAKADGEFLSFGPLRFVNSEGTERTFDTAVIRRPNGLIVRARDSNVGQVQPTEVAQADSAVVFLDDSYNVTYASASFPALVGRPATTAVGMELLAAVHPSDRSYAEQRLRQPGLEGQIHGFLRVALAADDGSEPSAPTWQWIEVIGRNYLDDPTVAQIALQLTAVTDDSARQVADVPQPERLGTFTRDRDGNVSFINDLLLEMLGNVDATEFAAERSSLVRVGDDGVSETIELDAGDGSVRFLRSRMSPIIGADGERSGDVAVVEDITRLVESGDLPDRVADGTEGSVLVVERGVGIKYLSADLAALTGAEVSTELHEFFTPKSAVLVRSDVWPAVLETGLWSGQLWLRSTDGPAVPFHAQFHNEADLDAGEPLASVILTPLESVPDWEHEDQLAVDPLTLLSSGAGLKRRAVRAIARNVGNRAKVAVALVEIDSIADVISNADEGFSMTDVEHDTLAVAIADRLALACRHDESAARIDQQTFGVLSQRLGDDIDLEHLTSRLVDELSPTFIIDSGESQRYLNVQFSLGVAHTGDRSLSADELFDNADLAVQRARTRGRVRTASVGENGQLEISQRRSLEEEFRAALSSDQLGNQLENAYQAVLPGDLARIHVAAKEPADDDADRTDKAAISPDLSYRFEALVRWHSPSRGVVGASEVIELADDLGMSSAAGHRVLDRALEFLSSTERKHGVSVQVDVNISAAQAVERGFASRLDALLRLYEVDPAQLGIELAEPVLLAADDALLAALENLGSLGVRLVVDDVTGRLFRSHFEGITELKINRRLVEGVGRHAADTAQVAGILARAHERGLPVTAVGVATGRQLDLLSELGCSWFQGFLLGRPHAANDHDFSGQKQSAAHDQNRRVIAADTDVGQPDEEHGVA